MSIAPLASLPLFAYGTLLDPLFIAAMLEHPVSSVPAALLDYQLLTLPGLDLPLVIAAEGRRVQGRLYRSLTAEDFRRLDAYEGVQERLYRRAVAQVVSEETAVREAAFVYVPTGKTLGNRPRTGN